MYLTLSKSPQTGIYRGKFFDGPDGIDEFDVEGNSLGECFEKIIAFQTRNELSYIEDYTPASER